MAPQHGRATIAPNTTKGDRSMKNVCAVALAVTIVIGWSLALASGPVKLDPALQPYKPTSGVSGNINSIGSDSLNNVMTLWAETFSKFYPNAKIQIEGKGSSAAPPALIAGTAQLGPMSRAMKGTEVDAFEKKYVQADSDPHGRGRSRGLRQQGQPRQVPDARAGGGRLLEVAARRPQGGRQDLGPARPDRRVGREAARPLRPQLGLGNLRLLQGARAEERRLQGRGQGAAGLGVRGPGRHRGPVRDRL